MGTAMRGGRAGPSSMGRPITGAAAGQDSQARPMTAVRAAGYTAAGKRGVSNYQLSHDIVCFQCEITIKHNFILQ